MKSHLLCTDAVNWATSREDHEWASLTLLGHCACPTPRRHTGQLYMVPGVCLKAKKAASLLAPVFQINRLVSYKLKASMDKCCLNFGYGGPQRTAYRNITSVFHKRSLQPCQEYSYITMSFQILKHSEPLLYLFWTINNSLLKIKKKQIRSILIIWKLSTQFLASRIFLRKKKSKNILAETIRRILLESKMVTFLSDMTLLELCFRSPTQMWTSEQHAVC